VVKRLNRGLVASEARHRLSLGEEQKREREAKRRENYSEQANCFHGVELLKRKSMILIAIFLTICLPVASVAMVNFIQVNPEPIAQVSSEPTPSQTISSLKTDKYEILIECPLPSMPSEVPNLKTVQRSDITEEKVKMIATELFGLTDPPIRSPYFEAYRIRSGNADLWITDYGSIDYYESGLVGLESPKNLPTTDDAKSIAEEFLEKIQSYGMTPQKSQVEIEFHDVVFGCQSVFENNLTIVYYWDVRFAIKFENMKIGEAEISVGDNGRIVGVQGSWREFEQSGNIRVITPMQAIELIPTEGDGKMLSSTQKIQITQITLEYWDNKSIQDNQDDLKPVYMFKCILTKENGETSSTSLRISAVA